MRRIGICVGLVSFVFFVGACDIGQECGVGDEKETGGFFGARAVCADPPDEGAGGAGGGGGGVDSDQFVDHEGICRSRRDHSKLGCAPTFDLALSDTGHCGDLMHLCAGTCGDWLVMHYGCTPGLGCTYDPHSRALVGVTWTDDVPSNCGETSRTVIYGNGHHGCSMTDRIIDNACW